MTTNPARLARLISWLSVKVTVNVNGFRDVELPAVTLAAGKASDALGGMISGIAKVWKEPISNREPAGKT